MFEGQLQGWIDDCRSRRGGPVAALELTDSGHILHELRLFKSPAELRLMREAARISVLAHERAMARAPAVPEYVLEAEIAYAFRSEGATGPAYPSIVGSGANACIMHYVDNAAPLPEDGLVLIDAGAEYQGYAADITRTFPASGRFTALQRQLYDPRLCRADRGDRGRAPWGDFSTIPIWPPSEYSLQGSSNLVFSRARWKLSWPTAAPCPIWCIAAPIG